MGTTGDVVAHFLPGSWEEQTSEAMALAKKHNVRHQPYRVLVAYSGKERNDLVAHVRKLTATTLAPSTPVTVAPHGGSYDWRYNFHSKMVQGKEEAGWRWSKYAADR